MSRAFQDAIDTERLAQGRIEATPMWWLAQLLPRPMSVAFAVVAGCSTIPWMAFAAQTLSTNRSPRHVLEMASATTWMCAAPTAFPFALLALVLAGSWGARFAMSSAFAATAGAVGVALVSLTLAMGGRGDDLSNAVLFPMLFLTPLLVVTAMLGVAARTEGRRRLLALRAQRALDLLERVGSMDAQTLLEALGGSLGDAADALERAHHQVPLERSHRRVWTASRHRAHKALLLARLESGERSVASLVAAVREPEEVVRAWLVQLADDDLLDVVVDGDRVEVRGEAQRAPCGGCGGTMGLVGRGLWRCLHCGNERTDP
jgi:hypothetical protein